MCWEYARVVQTSMLLARVSYLMSVHARSLNPQSDASGKETAAFRNQDQDLQGATRTRMSFALVSMSAVSTINYRLIAHKRHEPHKIKIITITKQEKRQTHNDNTNKKTRTNNSHKPKQQIPNTKWT